MNKQLFLSKGWLGCYSAAKPGLELAEFLPQPLKFWSYKWDPLGPAWINSSYRRKSYYVFVMVFNTLSISQMLRKWQGYHEIPALVADLGGIGLIQVKCMENLQCSATLQLNTVDILVWEDMLWALREVQSHPRSILIKWYLHTIPSCDKQNCL